MKSNIRKLYQSVFSENIRHQLSIIRFRIKSLELYERLMKYAKPIRILITKFLWVPPQELNDVARRIHKNKLKEKELKQQGAAIANYENLHRYKTSDTLFVLGSGSSINHLSKNEWDEIKKSDSIGFNLFVLHDFIPTFYHLEFTEEIYPYYYEIIKAKGHAAENVPLLINYMHVDLNRPLSDYFWLKNTYFTNPYRIYLDKPSLKRKIEYFYKVENIRQVNFYTHYRGSLSLMISLGVLLGYKKIVLMGVDLDNHYFFHNEELYKSSLAKKVRGFHLSNIQAKYGNQKIHATADKTIFKNDLTIDEYLHLYNEVLDKNVPVKLFSGSKTALLSKVLESYSFKTKYN